MWKFQQFIQIYSICVSFSIKYCRLLWWYVNFASETLFQFVSSCKNCVKINGNFSLKSLFGWDLQEAKFSKESYLAKEKLYKEQSNNWENCRRDLTSGKLPSALMILAAMIIGIMMMEEQAIIQPIAMAQSG